jgi:hypothetical protein
VNTKTQKMQILKRLIKEEIKRQLSENNNSVMSRPTHTFNDVVNAMKNTQYGKMALQEREERHYFPNDIRFEDVKTGDILYYWVWGPKKGGKQQREYYKVKIMDLISDEEFNERWFAKQLDGPNKGKKVVVWLSQLLKEPQFKP